MANELIVRNGLISKGQTTLEGGLFSTGSQNFTIENPVIMQGSLNIGSVGATTPVTNLGIDSSGNVVSGVTPTYKVYTSLLNQTGTGAPTAIVLENTIGSVSFNRISTGFYEITSSNLFVLNKMYLFLGNGNGGSSGIYENTTSSIYFDTRDLTSSGNPVADDLLVNTTIEIRVYP